jgi:hypothetical protein
VSRHTPACHPHRTGQTRAAWPSGPSAAFPLSCVVLWPEPSRRHHRRSGRPTPLPPLHHAHRGRRLASRRLAPLLATARVSIFPRTRSTSRGRALPSQAPPSLSPEPPQPSPSAVAARPRRSRLRSNLGRPCALGEHVVVPHCLPGRERSRLAASSCPGAQLQGLLSRVFTANRGHGCDALDLCRVLSVKVYLQ